MAARHALGPCIGLRTKAPRARAMASPLAAHTPLFGLVSRRRGVTLALCSRNRDLWDGCRAPLRRRTKKHGAKTLQTQLGFLKRAHQPKVQPDDLGHHRTVRPGKIAGVPPRNE